MTEQPVVNDSNPGNSKLPKIPEDRYTVISELGRGGMGVVLKARHASLNKTVAIKVLNASMLADEAGVKRFEVEAKAGSQLSHPNLVSVFDYGFTADREPYLVMEYIEGESLDDYLARLETIDKKTFIKIFEQVLKGLQYVHNHEIIHRDLKTSNIMIEEIDGDLYAKLLDFGVAKVLADSGLTMHNLTETGAAFGSPLYMSPEQCMGMVVDARSDIYSLGCVMYQCIQGLPPVIGANPLQTIHMQVNSEEPALIESDQNDSAMKRIALLIQKCLRKAPEKRFQSTQELLAEILSIKEEMEAEKYQSIPPNQPVAASDETLRLDNARKPVDSEANTTLVLHRQAEKNTATSNPWSKSAQTNPKPAQESFPDVSEELQNVSAEQSVSAPPDAEDGINARDLELRQITTQSLRQKDIVPPDESGPGSSIVKKLAVATMVAGLGIALAAFGFNFLDKENNSFAKAEANFNAGSKSWPEAEAIYIKLLSRDDTTKDTGIIYERLGEIHRDKKPDEAEANFRSALKALDKKDAEQAQFAVKSLVGLADINMARKQFDEAQEFLDKASKLAIKEDNWELKGDIKFGLARCTASNTDSQDGVKLFDEAISEYSKLSEPPAEKLAEAWVESAEFCNKIKWESEVPRRAKSAVDAASKIQVAHDKDEILRRAQPLAALEKKVAPVPQLQQAQAPVAAQPAASADLKPSQLNLELSQQNNALTQAQLDSAKKGVELQNRFSKFREKQFKKTTKLLENMSNSAQSVNSSLSEDRESMRSIKQFSKDFVER